MERNTLYQRTDRAIQDAMIRLLREKSFEKLTVQDILDETPVTRATFYAHYHDKYEVVERMQERYVRLLREIPGQLSAMDRARYPRLIKQSLLRHGELIDALFKVRTDRVDIRAATAELHRERYLARRSGDTAEAEAEIYAQTMTALQMAYLRGDGRALEDEDYYDKVMVEVFLRVLRLEDDRDLRRRIMKKLPAQHM